VDAMSALLAIRVMRLVDQGVEADGGAVPVRLGAVTGGGGGNSGPNPGTYTP